MSRSASVNIETELCFFPLSFILCAGLSALLAAEYIQFMQTVATDDQGHFRLRCRVRLCFYRAAAMQARSSYEHLSVCPSNACIVTKRTKVLPTFLYHMKGEFIKFSDTKNGWWGASPSTWNFGGKLTLSHNCYNVRAFSADS